jgi:hypothetical protein
MTLAQAKQMVALRTIHCHQHFSAFYTPVILLSSTGARGHATPKTQAEET